MNPGFIFLGVFIIAVILLTSLPALAKPPITWTPSKLFETVPPGKSKVSWVSFTSLEEIANVDVRVVHELAPYLQVDPNVFTSIQAGTPFILRLIITAPANSPHRKGHDELATFDGTIQLKSTGKSNKTFAKPLPVSIQVKVAGSPETVMADIVSGLEQGDIEKVIMNFTSTPKNQTILPTLNTTQLNHLAYCLENAQLVEEQDIYRVYRYEWIENNQKNWITFVMTKNDVGEWKLESW